MHARMRLRNTYNGLDVTHRDRYTARHHGLFSQIGVHTRNLVLVHVVEARVDFLFAVDYILLKQLLRYNIHTESVRYIEHGHIRLTRLHGHALVCLIRRVISHVGFSDEFGQELVLHAVHHVSYHAQNVETRQDGLAQVNVLGESERGIVATAERICCCQNGASSLKLVL